METRCSKASCEWLKRQLGYQNVFIVPSIGRKRGLVWFWKVHDIVELVSHSSNHIHAKSIMYSNKVQWRFMGFYGYLETNIRSASWALLSQLNPEPRQPWCIMGDLNEITCLDQKWGGKQRPIWKIKQFCENIESNDLVDLGWKMQQFT